MAQDRILVIEDDEGVCRLLRHSLAREDFDLQIVQTGKDGLTAAQKLSPALVLLDLGLPDIDGLEVCRQLKTNPETRQLPIVILTGKGEEADVVKGLEMGADDYIIKPFRPRILHARIRTVLRRQLNTPATDPSREEVTIGQLVIYPEYERITLSDETVDLSPSEFRFISALTRILLNPEDKTITNPSTGMEGMTLYVENRLEPLLPVFRELLEASPYKHPLLFKFTGLAQLNIESKQAEKNLYQAAAIFAQEEKPVAELAVLALLLLYHLLLEGDIQKATSLLKKSEQLEHLYFDRLDVISRISVAQSQAVGHALLYNNFNRAYEYLSVAEALAEDRGIEHFLIINHLVRAYESYITADTTKLAGTIDKVLLLFNNPQISAANKALLKIPQLLYISLTGSFNYFRTVEQALLSEFDSQLPTSSLPAIIFRLLQAQMAQAEDAYDRVTELLPSVSTSLLHQPLNFGMLALSSALSGNTDLAVDAITATLNSSQKMSFIQAQGQLYCIRTLLELEQTAEAATLLEQVFIRTEETDWRLIRIQALALSLLFHREQSLSSETRASLQSLLSELIMTDVRHLRCMTSDDLRFILCTAVSQNIERLFAIELCRTLFQVGFDLNWEPFPLLRFKTLGGLQLFCEGKLLLNSEGFSRSQRECLALLASAPKKRVDQEEMQLAFWPESHPDKARANLDTMLSRLRKNMQAHIKPLAAKNYLKLQKGIVSLEHCLFDIDELMSELESGRNRLRNREFWLAEIDLSHALSLWDGEFIPGACITDLSIKLADQVLQRYIETSINWSDVLNDLGQTTRATILLINVLPLDRCNEELIVALYRSYMRGNNSAKAGLLLRHYEEALQRENYPSAEIGRLLTQIRSRISK